MGKPHYDVAPGDRISLSAAGVRILTVFLYLSDVKKGGSTIFPRIGVKVKPKKGLAIIWPNVANENPEEVNMLMEHEASPVKEGLKRAANLWIHLYDHKKSF